jgi:hypothetical protein
VGAVLSDAPSRTGLVVIMLAACGFQGALPSSPDAAIDVPIDTPPDAPPGLFWVSIVGASATANNLVSTAPNGWNNAGAISFEKILAGDGYVEFMTSELGLEKALGLNHDNTSQSYNDIDFDIRLSANGNAYVYESSVQVRNLGTYALSDVFRVEIVSNVIHYKRNGTIVHTSTRTPVYPLFADAALYHTNSTFSNVIIVDLP